MSEGWCALLDVLILTVLGSMNLVQLGRQRRTTEALNGHNSELGGS